jgi:serine/threonine protein kinase
MANITSSVLLIPSSKIVTSGGCIGRGGFGQIYKGQWQGVTVAVKKLHAQGLSAEMKKEFEKECTVMFQLHHPHIVQLFGVCMDSEYAMVMEYAPNGNLYEFLHSDKELTTPLALEYGIGIALGVQYLHDCKVLHRDIKSHNVLLFNHVAKLCGTSYTFEFEKC